MQARDVVVGVFDDRQAVRDAIAALKDAGFSAGDISVLMPDRDSAAEIDEATAATSEVALGGAVAGGVLGGLTGWLIGIGSLAIPGIGPFIAAGAFATALSGAAIGAGVGAVGGALVGMGVPEEEAAWYERELHGGRTLVAVHAAGRYDAARDILRENGAYDVHAPEPDRVTTAALPTESAGQGGNIPGMPSAGAPPPTPTPGTAPGYTPSGEPSNATGSVATRTYTGTEGAETGRATVGMNPSSDVQERL